MANRMHPGVPPSQRADNAEGWQAKARKATDMVVHMERHFHPDEDAAAIRGRVIAHARKALGLSPDGEFFETMDVDLGEGVEPTEMMSTPGIFRLVANHAGIEIGDERGVETFMDVVQRTLSDLGL